MDYRVLLYYYYTDIKDPQKYRDDHFEFCVSNNLKGRIFVNHEGINGTVSGLVDDIIKYKEFVKSDERFKDIFFKEDEAEEHAFDKMHVRVRKELVNFSLDEDINPNHISGNRLKPLEWKKYLEDDNTVVIDARNNYEHDLGHFRGAIKPDIKNFRDLPKWIRENKKILEGKKILTYCTGGIRCEKFSGWLMREGYEDVNQLDGGIVTYGKNEDTKGELWDGSLYVFDKRISVPVNRVNPLVVGVDYFDGTPCERYINCSNPDCNKQILCSVENEDKYLGACSSNCRISSRNRYVIKNGLSAEEVQARLDSINNYEYIKI